LIWKIKDWFLNICEVYGSRISNWAWHIRWNKGNKNNWWKRHKSFIDHRKEFPYYPEKNKK